MTEMEVQGTINKLAAERDAARANHQKAMVERDAAIMALDEVLGAEDKLQMAIRSAKAVQKALRFSVATPA